MRDAPAQVRFLPAPDAMREGGVLGWVACSIGGLRIDGVVIRRTAEGRLAVFLPERADRAGRMHRIVSIPDVADRDSFGRGLLAVLRAQGHLS